ncbi:hypothetical protein TRP8649_00825 [Pelagimonas phthalicica]|uniref:Globin n=1 Tax=Pelagimonas phthalicica TaxID=1037362 RepID=A0A238J7Q1_9RHOB|nr:hypothetical protein [Pelagimonas phthalicica]TDS94732.1 hypothetical protein CLV87_1246 [Pelagimonas phthalicica]SMX26740.1 hypothetical protein TRP8649_00825 [Pelagimonas phthalicica]
MQTFDPSYLQEQFPKVFQKKGVFRDAFYGKLVELSPDLAPLFDHSPIAKTHMMERFLFDLVRASSKGSGISDLVQSFAASHSKFRLQPQHFTSCEVAMKHAFATVTHQDQTIPSDAEISFHMFLEIVFHELRKTQVP